MKRLLHVAVMPDNTVRRIVHKRANFGWTWCQFGAVWNWRAVWVGAHYGARDRRLCINLIPFLTLWVALPGGYAP